MSLNASVAKFDEVVAFYTTLFGVAPVKRKADYAKFDLQEPSVNFTLNAVPVAPVRGELDHFGVQLWSDETLYATLARVKSAGIAVREEINVECCYAGQNKFWVSDPDGRNVEFFHVLHDVEEHGKKPAKRMLGTLASASPAAACCAPGEVCE